jgi:LmbE family N-acetylglucosaminyl deacetylase
MATAVFFHAHPDDEAISTGGTMMLASEAGHRVVLVCATGGELGETHGLADEVDLGAVRRAELHHAAELMGVARLEFLGYRDSGMRGEDHNDHPASFWQADLPDAAARLADILRAEGADLITCYDSHGTYGHPDHIQVHRVGVQAAELAGVDLVYEATINRDVVAALTELAAERGMGEIGPSQQDPPDELDRLGVEAALITHEVDVSSVLPRKRLAMAAHSSQITADSFFLDLPDDMFEMAFGREWFVQRGASPGVQPATDIFEPLRP